MSDYTGAPTTVSNVAANGVMQELTAAQMASALPAGYTIKTPTKNFTLSYKSTHMNCFKGIPIICDAAILAALTATSAPVV